MSFALTHTLDRSGEQAGKYRWKIAGTVLVLFLLGSLLNVPFSREVMRMKQVAEGLSGELDISAWQMLVNTGIYSLAFGAVMIFVGLWFSANAGLGAPVLSRIYAGVPLREAIDRKGFWQSMMLSFLVAILLLGLFELQDLYYPVEGKMARPSKPFYALVAFSAGITEEVIFRLGLMSFLIAVGSFGSKKSTPSVGLIWGGIIISSLAFGLMHLPLSTNFVELSTFTVGVTMVGNLITGTTFGYIFWKRGLLVAMSAHVLFDLVFHVLGSPYT